MLPSSAKAVLRNLIVHLLTMQLCFALIRFGSDLHRHNVHHTCKKNSDCSSRMKTLWPTYQPVCCTTITCDEKYGNYYLVRSGCASKTHCQPIAQVKGYTGFAARIEKRLYDSLDISSEGDCIKTRQKVSNNLPNATFVVDNLPVTITTTKPPRNIPPVPCPCGNRSECCVHITCKDSLQKSTREYTISVECIPHCRNLVTKIRSQYSIYIANDAWGKRGIYENTQSAPPVEASCRETLYFYQWLSEQKMFND